ncbi:Uncharacterised protein [Mycobacterium tuberculosis]|nr:Uncharacterised protein [Mycobacterium tuberculosis]
MLIILDSIRNRHYLLMSKEENCVTLLDLEFLVD